MIKTQWIGAAMCLVAGTTLGAGFQLYTEGSAEALGQAAAISGRADLASLAWYNPAGLAGAKETTVMAGDSIAQLLTDFTSAYGATNNASMSDEWRHIPHFYYVQPLADGLTFTLSVNAPYGLITEWSKKWVGKETATYSDLSAMYVMPSMAFQATEKLAFSGGLSIVHAEAKLMTINTDYGIDLDETLKGDDVGAGMMLAMQYKFSDDWALGARYQSKVALTLEGDLGLPPPASVSLDASADLTLPASLNVGLANTSIENLSVGLDFVWTEWSSYDKLEVYTPLGTASVNKSWEDVWSIRLGGEYELTENVALRCGAVWDQSPIPDATVAPEMPDSNRYMATAGIGWTMDNIGIDLAYSYLWAAAVKSGWETVAEDPGTDGEYETTTHIVALSGSYSF